MPLVALKKVKKTYDRPVVDVEDFAIERGERLLLMGPSGCGKSTLLHLLSGVLSPDTGSIQIDGQSLGELSEEERDRFRAAHIGYIFQSFFLLDGYTALENVQIAVTFAGATHYERAGQLLGELGLDQEMHKYPGQLSVGQRQRVAVARALVNRPKLMLADEPTANLDPARAAEVLDLLLSQCDQRDVTLVAVSHDPSCRQRFSRVLEFGEVFAQ